MNITANLFAATRRANVARGRESSSAPLESNRTPSSAPAGARVLMIPLSALLLAASITLAADPQPAPMFDLSKEHVLYCVGYAHLDTQWRWDYATTIDRFIKDTLDQNFALFDTQPGYVFNFTGSVRYQMMKEYYPERYERLKKEIAADRWFVSGSSVDEGDANVPSPESIIRHVLYGNNFFRREFGKESIDFMLPDCFGFPASMPSIWAHCGLKGFSTQKLSWGSAVGIPFKIGVWEGPDGNSIIAALDPGPYVGAIKGRVDTNPEWAKRVEDNGERFGVFADYHYYGVGDQGGAPHAEDVKNYLASIKNPDSKIKVALTSSDQMYKDITPAMVRKLPRYKGDLLLTEHSAGTLTSQSYMKRWNRMAENLADASERASVWAWCIGGRSYPREQLEASWTRLLANQMHDILPGTSIPRAYTYSWNDLIIAMNGFAQVLQNSMEAVADTLDTNVEGTPLVVFNSLAIEREDVVEAEIQFDAPLPAAVRVFGPDGTETPSQEIGRKDKSIKVLFIARVPSVGAAVFDVRPAAEPFAGEGLTITDRTIENEHLKVTINNAGDVSSIIDAANNDREMLAAPAQLVFTHEKPRDYPAWNMDWADRKHPPIGAVDGPAAIRIVERGPVRATIEVRRESRGSIFTQRIRLSRGDAGRIVEYDCEIDWQSAECALKASFPLTDSNPVATYNWGLGTIERGNNEPTKYEVPSHEWFDLTDAGGTHGTSIIENSKYGSDKPSDNEVRLTLLYSPGVRRSYLDQHSQDWGRHQITYALYPHAGDWRDALTEWRGRRMNQPLRVFQASKQPGTGSREASLLSVDTAQVDVRAVKLAEDSDTIIVRVQELWGRPAGGARLAMLGRIESAEEVDGQERVIGPATIVDGLLAFEMNPYSIRSFALRLQSPSVRVARNPSMAKLLRDDQDVLTSDTDRTKGAFDAEGRSIPSEELPRRIQAGSVTFELERAPYERWNAFTCQGQTHNFLGDVDFDRLSLLMAADEDTTETFVVGGLAQTLDVQSWTGYVGQWDDRVWDREFGEIDFRCEGHVTDIRPAFIKRAPIVWFSTHRHHPTKGNEAYKFCYLYRYDLRVPPEATSITFPDNPKIKILAMSATNGGPPPLRPAAPLYDDFTDREPVKFRYEYPPPPPPVHEGVIPIGTAATERADSFDALTLPKPSKTDLADAASKNAVEFIAFQTENEFRPHRRSGIVDGRLPRLNDGEVAQSDDDTERCIWYDEAGRFYADLKEPRLLSAITTYSWHKDSRAPQYFSLWGSNAAKMPDPAIAAHKTEGWTLIASVDTRPLGQGGVHASRITADNGLGTFRWLLFAVEDNGQGTFFTEIDIDWAFVRPATGGRK